MNKLGLAAIAAGAIITAWAADTLKQGRRSLQNMRSLEHDMEEDHRRLVAQVVETNRALHPRPEIHPDHMGRPVAYGEEDELDIEEATAEDYPQ